MKKYLFLVAVFFLTFTAGKTAAETAFAFSPQWLAILHYQPALFGGYKGTIGSDNFYLSPEGKKDPAAELAATIKLFASDDNERKCLFPARYLLLKQQGLTDEDFPRCDEYDRFRQDLQPSGVTFLFTDAYMNNSSSLFGHTLLRIDTARKGTQLLAHGINYGAWTQGHENSFLYAFYGLSGFYPGGYTVKPYYDVINTYNNLENRDIWEYNLDLSAAELELFVAHIWEVGQTSTPYYFFTRNCSYMLMEVFDAVRPSLKLARSFPLQTIPLDTVKAAIERQGFVKSVNYRPSRERKIKHRIKQMNRRQYQAFLKAARNEDLDCSELTETEKADVLETAYQYVQYQYVAGDLLLADYRRRSFNLLKARNAVAAGQTFNDLKEGKNPADAHDSKLLAFKAGVRNGQAFQQLDFRPAYHALTDNPHGYLSGAEINFMNFSFRHYDHHDKYVFHGVDILQLASLSPIDEAFRAVSYRINLNVRRQVNPKTRKEGYVGGGNVGGGATFALHDQLWVYALSSVDGAYGGFLPHNQWVGAGVAGGFLFKCSKAGIKGEVKKIFATDKIGSTLTWSLNADYYLSRNVAMEAEFEYIQNYGRNQTTATLGLKKFF